MTRLSVLLLGLTSALVAFALERGQSPSSQSGSFDLIVRNGRVMDGSGNPWIRADVGIREGRIAAIGNLARAGATATRVIDAQDHHADDLPFTVNESLLRTRSDGIGELTTTSSG